MEDLAWIALVLTLSLAAGLVAAMVGIGIHGGENADHR